VEGRVVCGVDGDELALQMRREFGDGEAVLFCDAGDFIAVGFAFTSGFQIEKTRVPRGNLHAFVAEIRSPGADGVEIVERRRISGELCEEDCGSLDGFHSWSAPALLNLEREFC